MKILHNWKRRRTIKEWKGKISEIMTRYQRNFKILENANHWNDIYYNFWNRKLAINFEFEISQNSYQNSQFLNSLSHYLVGEIENREYKKDLLVHTIEKIN
ncbi:MAG: hypothetical protein AAGA77_12690 [Bacteroidota bacterium]